MELPDRETNRRLWTDRFDTPIGEMRSSRTMTEIWLLPTGATTRIACSATAASLWREWIKTRTRAQPEWLDGCDSQLLCRRARGDRHFAGAGSGHTFSARGVARAATNPVRHDHFVRRARRTHWPAKGSQGRGPGQRIKPGWGYCAVPPRDWSRRFTYRLWRGHRAQTLASGA